MNRTPTETQLLPLKASETPYERFDRVSRWPLWRVEHRFFIQISPIMLRPGGQAVTVIDVTDVADRLQLNQGQIQGGEVVFGPGEAYATVGSEGSYVIIWLVDGPWYTRIASLHVTLGLDGALA